MADLGSDIAGAFGQAGAAVKKASKQKGFTAAARAIPSAAGPAPSPKGSAPYVEVHHAGLPPAPRPAAVGRVPAVFKPANLSPTPFASGGHQLAKAFKALPPEQFKQHGGGGFLSELESLPGKALKLAEGGAVGGNVKTVGKGQAGGKTVLTPGATITASPINSRALAGTFGKGVENIPKSAVQNIAGIGPAAVAIGKAGGEALAGKPEAAEHLAKGIAGSFVHTLAHPGKEWEQNPFGTLLMLGGGEYAAGKVTGDAARAAGADFAKTERAPLKAYGKIETPREYSPDIIRKGGQVAADKFREKVLNQDPNQATGARLHRQIYGGGVLGQAIGKVSPIHLQGFIKPGKVDVLEGQGKMLRKMYMSSGDKFLHDIKPARSLKAALTEATPLALEGTLRRPDTVVEDLAKRHQMLTTAAERVDREGRKVLTGEDLKMNRAQLKTIENLQGNREFLAHPEPAFHAARDAANYQDPRFHEQVQLGHFEPDQEHAKYVPYAMSHMDLHYNQDPGAHPIMKEVADAKREVGYAKRAVDRAVGSKDAQRVADAKDRLLNAHHAHEGLKQDLQYMKDTGRIKNNGDMFPRLEDAAGNPISSAEIRAHAKNNIGDREIGFLTHKDETFASGTHSRTGTRPGSMIRSRTGTSYRTGAYDSSFEGLIKQFRKDSQNIAGHQTTDSMYSHFGTGTSKGFFHDKEDAVKAAENANVDPEGAKTRDALGPWVVRSIGPDKVVSRGNMLSHPFSDVLEQFGHVEHKAVNEMGPTGKWAILPDAVAKRIDQHDDLAHSSEGLKALQAFTNKWRTVALFTSPKWPVGTTQENMIRLAFAGANPLAALGFGSHALKVGRAVTDELGLLGGTDLRKTLADPTSTQAQKVAARMHLAAINAGSQYGSYINSSVHRQFTDVMTGQAKTAMQAFNESTGPAQMIKGWNAWTRVIGNGLKNMEKNTKTALTGKVALKEAGKFTGEWRALLAREDTAIKKFAVSKLSPNEASKFSEDLFTMAGNWNHLTPFVRKATQAYAPFVLWWLNSMKFVFKTLPIDHPMKTAALAAMVAATKKPGESILPEYLQGTVELNLPIVGKVDLNLLHYSPFGIAQEPLKTAKGMILPQLTDAWYKSEGIDPLTMEPETQRGEPKLPPGVRVAKGLESFPEGLIPGLRQGLAIAREGGKEVKTSLNPLATEPGSKTGLLAAAGKTLAPFPMSFNRKAAEKPRKGLGNRPPLGARPQLGNRPALGNRPNFGNP